MKRQFYLLLTILCLIPVLAYAQNVNLEKMSEKRRNKYLIELAKKTVLNYGPGYYREYKEPLIERMTRSFKDEVPGLKYVVTFLHDPTKDTLNWNYAAKVYIHAATGQANAVYFGNGYMMLVSKEYEKPNGEAIRQMPLASGGGVSFREGKVSFVDATFAPTLEEGKWQLDGLKIIDAEYRRKRQILRGRTEIHHTSLYKEESDKLEEEEKLAIKELREAGTAAAKARVSGNKQLANEIIEESKKKLEKIKNAGKP